MANGSKFVKGQKVTGPFGQGYVLEVTGDEVSVQLEGGEKQIVSADELEDDSDAG
jgi:sRNA-binding protein